MTQSSPVPGTVASARLQSIESPYAWWVAAVTLLLGSISFGAVTAVPILMKPISAEWGGSVAATALVHTSTMVGAAVGSLALGRVMDRVGFFAIALVAAVATGIGLAAAGAATNLLTLHLVFGLLVGGLGQGTFFSPMAGAVSLWFDRNRGLAIAIAASGQSVGGLVLPPILRWSAQEFGWRSTLSAYACVSAALLTAGAFAFRRQPPTGRAPAGAARTNGGYSPMAPRLFVLLGVCCALSNVATFVVIGHLTAFGEERGMPAATAAGMLSSMLGVTIFSRLSMGAMCARLGHYRCLLGVSLIHVIGVWMLATASNQAVVVAGVVVIGVGFGGYLPGYAMLAREMFPAQQAGRRISEIYFLAFVAAGAGSWLGGCLRDLTHDYALAFFVAGAFAAAGALLLFALGCTLRRPLLTL